MLRHFLGQHAKAIEPNWYQIVVEFGEDENDLDFLKRGIDEQDACRVSFDYRPTAVTLIGPKHGHTDWTRIALQLAPEQLFMLVCLSQRLFGDTRHVLCNPKHHLELIEGKTLLRIKDGSEHVVCHAMDEYFDTETLNVEEKSFVESPGRTCCAYVPSLLSDLTKPDEDPFYIGFTYLPLLPLNGMPMDTALNIRRARWSAAHKR